MMGAMKPPPEPAEAESGSWRGFDEFFLRSRRRVIGGLMAVTGSADAAEDAAQEAYSRAARRWDELSKDPQPEIWVLRVGTNLAIDNWRKRRRERELGDWEGSETPSSALIENAWLRWGLESLTPHERALLVMHHAHGQPVSEIAKDTMASESAVKKQLQRARARIRRLLASEVEM